MSATVAIAPDQDVFIDFSRMAWVRFDDQPRCGQVFEGIEQSFCLGLMIATASGKRWSGSMMIDNNDLHPCVVKKLHFRESIYAAVHRDQQADFFSGRIRRPLRLNHSRDESGGDIMNNFYAQLGQDIVQKRR